MSGLQGHMCCRAGPGSCQAVGLGVADCCGRARCAEYLAAWARDSLRIVLAQWRACAARRAGVPVVQ